jgi:hypothetical protein
MPNTSILIGLNAFDPMIISVVVISAGIPFVLSYLRQNAWKVSLGQLMLAAVPIVVFAYGFLHHVKRCKKYRVSEAGYFSDPVENFLYMSIESTNIFMTALCVSTSVVWLLANLRSPTSGGPQRR